MIIYLAALGLQFSHTNTFTTGKGLDWKRFLILIYCGFLLFRIIVKYEKYGNFSNMLDQNESIAIFGCSINSFCSENSLAQTHLPMSQTHSEFLTLT